MSSQATNHKAVSGRNCIKRQMEDIIAGNLTTEEEFELLILPSDTGQAFDVFLLRAALRRCYRMERTKASGKQAASSG